MPIQTSKETTALIVTITGRMDALTAPEYEKKFSELIAEGEISFMLTLNRSTISAVPGCVFSLLQLKGSKL